MLTLHGMHVFFNNLIIYYIYKITYGDGEALSAHSICSLYMGRVLLLVMMGGALRVGFCVYM